MPSESKEKQAVAWLILLLLGLTWGSSFILMKKSLQIYSSSELGALRIVISFLFLLPFALARIRNIRPKTWLILLLAGILGNGAPAFLFAKAQTVIDSSVAGILNSLTPLFTVLVGLVAFRLRLRWFKIFGVILGLSGAVGLLYVSGSGEFSFRFGYALYIIFATIFYAVNVNLIKSYLAHVDSVGIVSLSFMLIGLPVLIYLLVFTGFIPKMSTHPAAFTGLGYIAILAIGGTSLALMLFNKLLKMTDPVFASSVTYLIPIIAIVWGVLDGERFNLSFLLWIFMILSGIILVGSKKPGSLPLIGYLIRKVKI